MAQRIAHLLACRVKNAGGLFLTLSCIAWAGNVCAQDSDPTDGQQATAQHPATESQTVETKLRDRNETSTAVEDVANRENAAAENEEHIDDDWPYVDVSHRAISGALESAVKAIDLFFADSKIYRDATRSYVQLTGDVIFREAGDIDFDGRVRAKIDLPKTKERLKFLIETDPEDRVNIEGQAPTPPPTAPTEQDTGNDYFASIEGVFKEIRRWDIRPSLGVNFSQPIDPFARLRLRRNTEFVGWTFRFEQNFFWFDSVGTVSNSLFEFNHALNRRLLFRSSSAGTWRNETEQFELSQVFTVFQTLSKRRALAYDFGVFGNDEPTVHATNYVASVRYRQNIHKKWLFFEAIPAVNYLKDDNWEPIYSFTLRLDAVFGSRYI